VDSATYAGLAREPLAAWFSRRRSVDMARRGVEWRTRYDAKKRIVACGTALPSGDLSVGLCPEDKAIPYARPDMPPASTRTCPNSFVPSFVFSMVLGAGAFCISCRLKRTRADWRCDAAPLRGGVDVSDGGTVYSFMRRKCVAWHGGMLRAF
jgi:hypothetical protein